MKVRFLFGLFILIPLLSFQQKEQAIHIALRCDFFTTDHLGFAYLINADEIIKYDGKGNEIYRYSDKSLGIIGSMDANNALKLVVFYRDLSMVAVLDNTLSIHGTAISLSDKEFDQVTLVCRSQRENLWLYDQENMEIIQTDINLNVIARSGNLAQILSISIDQRRHSGSQINKQIWWPNK